MGARGGAPAATSRGRRNAISGAGAAILSLAATLIAPLGLPEFVAVAAAAEPPAFLGTLAGPSQAAMYPSGGEYDPAGDRLVLADTGRDRVLFYALDGTALGGFGEYGTDPGQFASPRDIAVDGEGNLYVADAENNRIQTFTSTGAFRWERGGMGTGAGSLNTPIGLTWDHANNVLLVASTGQSLIKAWNAAGDLQWTSPGGNALGAHAMRDVGRGPDGRIWVSAYNEHQIKAYDVTAAGVWTSTPALTLGDGASGGSGAGQLNYPYNVGFSADGNTVYVADTGNGRIARWDLSGATPTWLPPFGGRCANHPQPCEDPPVDAGRFNHLRRVLVDPDGLVYGADFWGAGLEVFDPTGASVLSIEGDEPPVPGFSEAYAVDVAPDGTVYVMDRLNHRIQRFAADGTYLTKVGARGTQPATFSWPEGLTVGADGSVWALDTRGGRLERFPADLATTPVVDSWGETGPGVGQLSYPSNADVAPDGSVWIADTRNDRLQVFDPETETFRVVGSAGPGLGQFQDPMGVAVTEEAVYVADTGNNRVQRLNLDGTSVGVYTTALNGPQGIEVAPDGTVWVADTTNNRLVHLTAGLVDIGDGFGALGSCDRQFFEPHDLAFGNGRMYVADTYNSRVQMFTWEPFSGEPPPRDFEPRYVTQLSDPGGQAPFYPAGLAIDADGTWYASDSGGDRLVTVDPGDGSVSPLVTAGLTGPRDVDVDATDPGSLWVADTGGRRLVRLSTAGVELAAIPDVDQPYGLANDSERIYAASTYDNAVLAFDRSGLTPAWTATGCLGIAFSRPRDVAVADNGRILVADTDNDRIAVLDQATGGCLRQFGRRGTDEGQFKSPRSVTPDGSGGVWVTDAFNYRIQHLTATGDIIGSTPVDAYGSGPAQFRSAHCAAPVPGTDRVAVCDTYNFRIAVYGGAGVPTLVSTVGGTPPAPGGFNGPFGVAYGPGGELYVADWFNHRIQKFDADGAFELQWGGYGTRAGSLIFPRNVVVDEVGNVVVTDSENNRIDVFSSDGDFLRQVKPPASEPLRRPHQTAVDGDTFWVADTTNDRIVHLGPTGVVLGQFALTGGGPQGVAVDADGSILVSHTQRDRVERYTPEGDLVGTVVGAGVVNRPAGLTVSGEGSSRKLWISDAGNDRIVVLDDADQMLSTFGSPGTGDARLDQPRGVAFDPTDGDIAVADHRNDRLSLWTIAAPAPICEELRHRWAARFPAGSRVVRFGPAAVEYCYNGSVATVRAPGVNESASAAAPRLRRTMAKVGLTVRDRGVSVPVITALPDGSARLESRTSYASGLKLTVKGAVLTAGIRAAARTAPPRMATLLRNWAPGKIVRSPRIPTKVKKTIVTAGIVAVLDASRLPAADRSGVRALTRPLVKKAFRLEGNQALVRLTHSRVTKSGVWAPVVRVTISPAGTTSAVVGGRRGIFDLEQLDP